MMQHISRGHTMIFKTAILVLLLPWRLNALTHEEAGVLDFKVATSGHGPLKEGSLAVLANNECLLTSDAGADAQGSSCYVACRSPKDGSLNWRRNVCTSATDKAFSVLYERTNSQLFSVDASSIVRAWQVADGSLLWEQQLSRDESWTSMKMGDDGEVQIGSRSKIQVLSASNGDILNQRGGSLAADKQRAQSSVECHGRSWSLDSSRTRLENSSGESLDLRLASDDQANDVRLLSCAEDSSAALLIVSARGVSTLVACTTPSRVIMWSKHEGLSSISQAILLDSSHKLKQQVDNLLSFKSRLDSQWKRITSTVSAPSSESNNHLFGFIKSSVLLSPASHAVYGMDTTGENRAEVTFVVNLPFEEGTSHVMVHGAPNAASGAHGIHGGTLSKHVLVVSHGQGKLHWICIDGTTGATVSEVTHVQLTSPVLQVLPMTTTSASPDVCQQSAILVLADKTALVIPDLQPVRESVQAALTSTPHGFYTHAIDYKQSLLETYWISGLDSKSALAGSTSFPNERIVHVAYPIRDEVVSSPTVALGDDSLLLKYMNPHLMVIITMQDASDGNPSTRRALEATMTDVKGKQVRKPVGVTSDDGAVPGSDEPNLFVNVVDSVSGRVLYRMSHSNALNHPQPTVAISENWIYYTFTNAKTRRAELGVLSLYEGMIDSKGLSAFTAPQQGNTFSSLDAPESKPLVLAKVYSLARPVTAIGVTTTHKGISNHRLVLAGVDGQVYNIERKTLDPRRPVGELKDAEKKEGLMQYSEFIPMISFMSLSYHQTIENVKGIITTPTDLESQSLILAFGGPDIFFTRTSPSRGFDLLPESFSRPLLSILVVGLLVVLFGVKRRVASKTRLSGWA